MEAKLADEALEKELAAMVPGGVHWFPGHMAKANRQIAGLLKLVHVVIEVLDSRAPASSRNQDLAKLAPGKAHVMVLTKEDLAVPAESARWIAALRRSGEAAFLVNSTSGAGVPMLLRYLAGLRSGGVRALVAGVPNTGKSSLINRMCQRAATRTGARPGITRGMQWLQAAPGVELLDSPGVLWPRLDSLRQGLHLLWIGSIGENAYQPLPAATALAYYLSHLYPGMMTARYGIAAEETDPQAILFGIGQRRGCLGPGGVVDVTQAAVVLLTDMRQGRLGRITFDKPPAPVITNA